MSFDIKRKYDVHLIVGSVAPWTTAGWREVAACLDPIFGGSAKTAVRTGRPLGRLGWRDSAKWTGGARAKFHYAELWSPSWTECERRDRPPDAFLKVSNPAWSAIKGVVSLTLFACALDCEVHAAAAAAAHELITVLGAVSSLNTRRPWARDLGDSCFGESIQDLLRSLECDERTGALRLPKWQRSS